MRDSFDHWREEKFGDERTSLPGSDFEVGEGAGRREEEEDILPVYQDRSCLEGYVVFETYDPEPMDRRPSLNRLSSLSDEELNSACGSTLDSQDDLRINEWRCDYSSCGRVFNTRRDLNQHRKYHFKPFKCLVLSCEARNVGFSLEKDLRRHQASHEGERYFCPHIDCSKAAGGKFTGFARTDNWRRHLETQHT